MYMYMLYMYYTYMYMHTSWSQQAANGTKHKRANYPDLEHVSLKVALLGVLEDALSVVLSLRRRRRRAARRRRLLSHLNKSVTRISNTAQYR